LLASTLSISISGVSFSTTSNLSFIAHNLHPVQALMQASLARAQGVEQGNLSVAAWPRWLTANGK
jgi:hypothetical protein